MYYVVAKNEPWKLSETVAYSFHAHAIHKANKLCKQNGKSYIVVSVEPVWTISTLADLMDEDAEKEA